MKVVFEYIENYLDPESPHRKSTYHVFDLTSRVDRRRFHEIIDDYADELIDTDMEHEEKIEKEKDRVHELISNQEPQALYDELFWYFKFKLIENTLHEQLIKEGYEVERSNASSSLYVKLNGKGIRISNHKRPAYDSGYEVFEEHKYDFEIITEDNLITKKQLESVGINLKGDEFYLA